MSAPCIIWASLPSFCQKLSKLVEIWRSCDKNNFAQSFFETRCTKWFIITCVLQTVSARHCQCIRATSAIIYYIWICLYLLYWWEVCTLWVVSGWSLITLCCDYIVRVLTVGSTEPTTELRSIKALTTCDDLGCRPSTSTGRTHETPRKVGFFTVFETETL